VCDLPASAGATIACTTNSRRSEDRMRAALIECARLIIATACALLLLPIVLALAFLIWIRPDLEPRVCERPEMTFAGVPYKIELCIISDFDTRKAHARLRIYDRSETSLLADRSFVFLFDYSDGDIEYLENGIRYTDETKTQNIDLPEEKFLRFPPTKWDWLTANLIRLTYDP